MAKISNNDIENIYQDWGLDNSNGLPYSGRAVQKFIKDTLNSKMGILYYDASNNRYLVFTDENTKNEYLEDSSKTELILGTFSAPFEYEAKINLLSQQNNVVPKDSVGNSIEFTFDTLNKSGASVGEDIICTFTFIRGSVKNTITKIYKYGTLVKLNIDDYIQDGTNRITVGIVGQTTFASTTIGITYEVVNLSLTDLTDISKVYTLNKQDVIAEIPFSVSGTGVKIIEWYVDGVLQEFNKNTDEVVELSTSRTKYLNLDKLSRGVHAVEFRAYTAINGEKFYSKTLHRDIIIDVPNSVVNSPIVALSYDKDKLEDDGVSLEQYIPYKLVYSLYNPLNIALTDVFVSIDNKVVDTLKVESGIVNEYTFVPNTEGVKTIKLYNDDFEYSLTINIKKTSLNIQENLDGIELNFNASNKTNNSNDKDTWSGNGYTAQLTGFKFNSTSGWVDNKLLITDGNNITFNYSPLTQDATKTGKTLEFEFISSNVYNDNAVICDLRDSNGVGILITASEASICSRGEAKLSVKYKPEEQLRVSFVINKSSGVTNKGLVFIYVNGILSGAVSYSDTDDFISDKELSFNGTRETEAILKQVMVYAKALTSDEILNNYILYRDDSAQMLSVYNKNDVYDDGTLNLSIDKLKGQLPVMLVTGDIPILENTTNKDTQITVDIEYHNLQDPDRSFTMKNAAMRPQGTSSMLYPKKNFRIYTNKIQNTILYNSKGEVVKDKLYAFKEGAQPVDCWCLKADYAESSGTHNTGIARLWNEILYNTAVSINLGEGNPHNVDNEYVLRTEAQKKAIESGFEYDVRTTIDGFPILMFYRKTVDSQPIFIGKYNFNNDKSTESVFGFEGIPNFDNSKMQCWEILNNGDSLALFTDVSDFSARWSEAFESRYPDTKTPNIADLRDFSIWLNGVNGEKNLFSIEKWEHMNVYLMAAYYIYLMRFGAVDQTVKNAMLTSEDGIHFYFINYDNDTINGLRNNGVLVFDPTIDRQSLDPETNGLAYAYAGHDSVLWNMLEGDNEFMSIVAQIDNALYANGLSYDRVIKVFNEEQADKWNERIYNQDSQYKYISPYTDSGVNNLLMLQGKRQSHRNWWLSKRFSLYDSKFVSGDFKGKALEFKVINNTEAGWSFKIEAGTNMEYGFGVYNPIETGVYLEQGQSHDFTVTQTLNIGDPVRVYSAVNLQGIDLSNILPRLSNIELNNVYSESLGTKLKKVILGNGVAENTTLTTISSLPKAKRLEELDIRGCKAIKNIDLSQNKYLKVLKATSSGLTSFSLAEGIPLTTLELPDTIQSVVLKQLPQLDRIYIDNNSINVRIFNISGSANIVKNVLYFTNWLDNKTTEDSKCVLHLDSIEWKNIDPTILQKFIDFKRNGGDLVLKGSIYLNSSTQELADGIIETFGENVFKPTNELYINAPTSIYITGAKEIIEGESIQYKVTVFSQVEGQLRYEIQSGSRAGVTLNGSTGLLTTIENGVADTTMVIRASFYTITGETVEATTTLLIKKKIYPAIGSVSILGSSLITDVYHKYSWISTTQNITGEVQATWELTGDILQYVRIDSYTNTECTLYLYTPILLSAVGELKLTLTKVLDGSTILTTSIAISAINENIIMTSTSNPEVMEIMHANGFTESPDVMTKLEAIAIRDIGTFFYQSKIVHFDEFQYFTNVTSIPANAFYECSFLERITLPDGITEIGDNAFNGDIYLNTINIPKGVLTIGASAFAKCYKLFSVQLPEGIKTLESRVFQNSGLTQINLPESLEILGSSCFYETNLKELVIPYNVDRECTYLCCRCWKLTKVVINKKNHVIGQSMFEDCTSLEEVSMGTNIRSISTSAFSSCSKLKNINLHEGLQEIKNRAFEYSGLESIVIPSSVNNIGPAAFKRCVNLKTIEFEPVTAPTMLLSAFSGSYESDYTGRNTYNTGENKIYLPINATGYETGYYLDPLQNADKCGFTIYGKLIINSNKAKQFEVKYTTIDSELKTVTVSEGTCYLNDVQYGTSMTISTGGAAPQTITYSDTSNEVTFEFAYEGSWITIDQNISDPETMISGDINGEHIQLIRANSHRYLGKNDFYGGVLHICQLHDDNSELYEDGSPATLTGDDGDVFMKMPTFWYKCYSNQSNVWNIGFYYGEDEPEGGWKKWDGNTLIGVYKAGELNGEVRSVSGITNVRYSYATMLNGAEGRGFQLVDWQMHCVMAILFYALYGDTDSQSKVGQGVNLSTINSGQTNQCGMHDTMGIRPSVGINDTGIDGNTLPINFWGLEAWWGISDEWIDNMIQDGERVTTEEADGTIREIVSYHGRRHQCIKKMLFGEFCDMFPTNYGSDMTTGFCDNCRIYNYSDPHYGVRSGDYNYLDAGVAFLETELPTDTKGSRLAYRGDIVEIKNSADFKQLSFKY